MADKRQRRPGFATPPPLPRPRKTAAVTAALPFTVPPAANVEDSTAVNSSPVPEQIASRVPIDTMGQTVLRLKQEVMSLLAQDRAIFSQFLEIRKLIAEIKKESLSNGSTALSDPEEESADEGEDDCGNSDDVKDDDDNGEKAESPTSSLGTTSSCSPPASLPSIKTSSSEKTSFSSLTGGGRFLRKDSFGMFHKHVVTFPPSRGRCFKLTVAQNEGKSETTASTPKRNPLQRQRPLSSVDFAPRLTPSSRRMSCADLKTESEAPFSCDGLPPLMNNLYRSTSVTILPRGILVRRAGSCDSGFDGSPSDGEIFV